MTWYRVHFRKGCAVVNGDAELERIRARKVPKVVLVKEAVEHKCSRCGFVGAWWTTNDKAGSSIWGGKWPPTAGWAWYGYYRKRPPKGGVDSDSHARRRVVLKKYCPDCRPADMPSKGNRHFFFYEPLVAGLVPYSELYDARKAADPRIFPRPKHSKARTGNGWCRWCGKAVEKPRRTWHEACFHEFNLHTNMDAQYWHLVERDGWGCGVCGRTRGHVTGAGLVWHDPNKQTGMSRVRWSETLEVDHVVPLWSVAHLPDDERRAYFGPDNLWLLCQEHHRGKTAYEAKERAAARR